MELLLSEQEPSIFRCPQLGYLLSVTSQGARVEQKCLKLSVSEQAEG